MRVIKAGLGFTHPSLVDLKSSWRCPFVVSRLPTWSLWMTAQPHPLERRLQSLENGGNGRTGTVSAAAREGSGRGV